MKAVVVMASNATPSKVDATRAYGAEVVQHGTIWDEANEKAKQLCEERGLTYIHPFDDMQLITGQGTLGLEVFRDFPGVDVAVVPIGVDGAESVEPKDQDHWRGIVRWSSDAAERRSRPRHHARSDRLHHRRPTGEARGRSHIFCRAAFCGRHRHAP